MNAQTRNYPITDPLAARRCCAAVLQCALKDAEGRRDTDRFEAIAWLASKDATLYMDGLNIPQSTFLTRSGWMGWANEALMDLGPPTTTEQVTVIWDSLKYLKTLKERQVIS